MDGGREGGRDGALIQPSSQQKYQQPENQQQAQQHQSRSKSQQQVRERGRGEGEVRRRKWRGKVWHILAGDARKEQQDGKGLA